MLGFIRQVAALLFIIAVPVALVLTNIRIAVNEPQVYEYAADHYDTPGVTGIPRSETLRAGSELRAYFRDDRDAPPLLVRNEDGDREPLFTSREREHLADVKSVMQGAFRVQEAAVLFALAYIVAIFIWAREWGGRVLATQLIAASGLGLLAIGGIGVLAVVGFETFWDNFHGVLFDNDLWQLDPDRDRLIQMFPEDFWRDVTIWIGIGTIAELALLAAVSALYLLFTRAPDASFEEDLAMPNGVRV